MSVSSQQPADDVAMDENSSDEETTPTSAALQKHLDTVFGAGIHHPAGLVERKDDGSCHMLLVILASEKAGGVALPGCNLATRTGIVKLLRDAFGLQVTTLYQPTNSTRAWVFPVDSEDADRLRAGIFRLAPNLGFSLFSTYGAPPKKTWTYVTPVTDNVDLDDMRKAIKALPTVRLADKPKRVTTREGITTEKVLARVQFVEIDLAADGIPPPLLGVLRGCYVRSFRVPGSLTNFELRSLPPCSVCGFLNHFVDACPYTASLATAPLLELTAPTENAPTSSNVAGPAKAPREAKPKKTKGKKGKKDVPTGMSEKAQGKQKAAASVSESPPSAPVNARKRKSREDNDDEEPQTPVASSSRRTIKKRK